MKNQNEIYKLAVLGSKHVTQQFYKIDFIGDLDPTVDDCSIKKCTLNDKEYSYEIFYDVMLHDFTSLRSQYLRMAHGFLIVYDVSDCNAFSDVRKTIDQVLVAQDKKRVPIVIVGNKEKCDNHLQTEFIEKHAKRKLPWNAPVFEILGITNENSEKCFSELVKEIVKLEKPCRCNSKKKRYTCTTL